MRNPIAAGTFYPRGQNELISELERLFSATTEYLPEAKGIVVPHAGYTYSGTIAAMAYKAVTGIKKRNFVILGVDHYGIGVISTSVQDWLTPLGPAKVNLEMVNRLGKEHAIMEDERAMKYEHSIEVQLPFLQYCFGKFTFVPLQLPRISYSEIQDLAKILTDKDSFFIVSSDFTHYGPNYGFVPKESVYGPDEFVKNLDAEIIDLIVKGNARKFMEYIEEKDMTVCGYVPITLLMEMSKKLDVRKIKPIGYDTSFSVSHDTSAIVGYAGIVFT